MSPATRATFEVVNLFRGGPSDNELVQFRWSRREDVFDIKVWTADFTVRLNGQNPPQEILIFSTHLIEVFNLDLIPEHSLTSLPSHSC
jgi:hypothetical protein